jgi:site-specific recombinase XerD
MDLRHSCANLLYEKGLGLKKIQKWLGYSDIKITSNIYTHISNLHMQTVAKSLESSFNLSVG